MGKQLKIEAKLRSINETMEETFFRRYDRDGNLVETRVFSNEWDYECGSDTRVSADNGRTWGEWKTNYSDARDGRRGRVPGIEEGDEYLGGCAPSLYDPKTGCTVGVGSTFYFIKGHDIGYFAMWEKGEDNTRPHAYYAVRYPDGREVKKLIELEEGGADYDPENPRNPTFLDKNRAMAGDLIVLPDGDLAFNLYPSMRICCKLAGVDVNAFYPSCPDMQVGLVVVRMHWNAEKGDYDFIYSNPIMLCDLQSSRGIMEPQTQILPGGRWIIVFRGSNVQIPEWHTRVDDATPGYKWFVLSDDGGKTFTPPVPWHFDTKEVVYSSATISAFFRSSKNGRLYWLGNVIDEPWKIDGNGPRYPFHICEVDEEHCCLKKDTLTVVDTIRGGETNVELSNPNLFEDRETKNLEIRISKINFTRFENGKQIEFNKYYSEAWEYVVEFPED